MKKHLMTFFALALTGLVQAQQNQGRIVYERTVGIKGLINGMKATVTPSFMEVLFANDQSVLRQMTNNPDGSGGITEVNNSIKNNEEVTFSNLKTGIYVMNPELEGEKYLVTDSINKLIWTHTGETKEILGYKCEKATAQRIRKSKKANGNNGEMMEEEKIDNYTVWYAPSIPVAAGPDWQGQLPGLILELVENNDQIQMKFIAKELSAKVDLVNIKAPAGGMKIATTTFFSLMEEAYKKRQEKEGNKMLKLFYPGNTPVK